MSKTNGFTVVEVLIVLFLVSMISVLVITAVNQTLLKQATRQFLAIFESDIMLVQSEALATLKSSRLTFYDDEYVILVNGKQLRHRSIPNHLSFSTVNNSRIQYSNNGTIVQPTTYLLRDRNDLYRIVFPFGKGRHYVEKH